MFKGIGVSSGIGIAPAIVLKKQKIEVPYNKIEDIAAEINKFISAHAKVVSETIKLYDKALKEMGESEAAIFEAHRAILEDEYSLVEPIKEIIRNKRANAAMAVEQQMDEIIGMFESMDDEYMKERGADAKDIKTRLLQQVLGIAETDLGNLDQEYVVVAYDLTPSDTAKMDVSKVLGIVTQVGGRTSHTAIMARTLEIPAVVGVAKIIDEVHDHDNIMIDGDSGDVFINPTQEEIQTFQARVEALKREKEALLGFVGKHSVTSDGHQVELVANIGTPDDLPRVLVSDAEGVGLFRSEFLYMDRDTVPTEEEQFESYKKVLTGMKNKPVIVRTLDIGGDKELPALNLPKEDNPFLGYRAIRLCLDRVDIFKVQLRALMRASHYGNLKIMFPMISSIGELRNAKSILEEVKQSLRNEKVPFSENVQVGIMVEIPATAVLADIFAKECDFFSIGTNDLIQYTVAVDRGNEKIAHLYSQYHPAVLRLIHNTIKAAHDHNIFCGMCGEAAGDIKLVSALVGMGLDEFSMSPSSVLKVRKRLSELNYQTCQEKVQQLLNMATAQEVSEALEN